MKLAVFPLKDVVKTPSEQNKTQINLRLLTIIPIKNIISFINHVRPI